MKKLFVIMSAVAITSCASPKLPPPQWNGPLPDETKTHYRMDLTVYVSASSGQPEAEWEAAAQRLCDKSAHDFPSLVPRTLPRFGHGPLTTSKSESAKVWIPAAMVQSHVAGSGFVYQEVPGHYESRQFPSHFQVNGVVDCLTADDWSSK